MAAAQGEGGRGEAPSGREGPGPWPRKPGWWRTSVTRGRRPTGPSSEAERLRRKAQMGGGGEQLGKLEREFRAERRRDYFRSPLRLEAASTLRAAREAARASEGPAGTARAEDAT